MMCINIASFMELGIAILPLHKVVPHFGFNVALVDMDKVIAIVPHWC